MTLRGLTGNRASAGRKRATHWQLEAPCWSGGHPRRARSRGLELVRALLLRATVQRLVVLALLVGCSAEPEARCGEAAEVAASCHGIDADTFLDACDQASPEEATELADAMLAQACPSSDGKADGLGEWAFVEACRPVIMSAYLVNQARTPVSARLPDDMKAKLRPRFGGLVDRVRIHWNATLLDDWPMLHVKDAFMDIGAQTFGAEIFVAASRESAPLSTIAHELVHAAQAERFGGVLAFYRAYCGAFYDADYSYDGNALEVEAYAVKL